MENANIMPKKERIEMKGKFLTSVVLVLTFILAACAPKAAPATKKATVPTSIPPAVKATATPTKGLKATPTATKATPTEKPTSAPTAASTPTSVAAATNDITVHDQAIKSDTVLVSLVDAAKPGWVAILTDDNGQPGKVLGYTAVPAGKSTDVKVSIDASKAPDKMIAMLLTDAGKMGTFEYPGPDAPIKNASLNTNVMATFNKLGSQ